jgi:predicted nucleic acid-binding protein
MSRLILNSGAFIAFEKGDATVRARLTAARRLGMDVVTTSPVVGQVWRDGRRQALLAQLLSATHVFAPDAAAARRAGEILAKNKSDDVVDAFIAGLARDGDVILTSDASDIRALLAAGGTRATVLSI